MANTAVVGVLRALLTADTAEFDAAMKRAGDGMRQFSKDAQSFGRQAQQLGSSLTTTLTLPLVAFGASVIKASTDFESSFAGVRKTVDATEPEFKAMEQQFRNLAKSIPVSVNELNRLGEAAGALGIPKKDIVEFSRVMAELGVTTNLTSDQAANAIARIQNIFGAAGKDTERLASTLVALGNAGASTESEIVEMAQRIAGAGHTIGLTQDQVLSFASSLASVGINAEAGGSAISRIFLKMNDAVMDGGEALSDFAKVAGMSAQQFKKAFETDAASATSAFIAGLGKLREQGVNTNQVMEGLIGKNIILKDTLNRLSGAGELLNDQLKIGNTAWRENSALSLEAGERFKTTASRVQLLWNNITDLGITMGNAFRPAIDLTIRGIQALIPVLETVGKWFENAPTWVQVSVVAFGALVAAAGPVIYIMGQIILNAGLVAKAFGTQGIATKVLASETTVLSGTLGVLAKTAAVVGVALTGWEVGKWLGKVTGATDGVEYLTGKLMGLSDAEIQAGYNARRQAEAHQAQGDSSKAVAAVTKALEEAQKGANAAVVAGTSAWTSHGESTKEATKAKKAAEKAAKEMAAEIEKERAALSALGVVTERDVNKQIEQFETMLARATKEGVDMRVFLEAVLPKLKEWADKAKKAGIDTSYFADSVKEVEAELKKLHGAPPVIDPKKIKVGTDGLADLLKQFPKIDAAQLETGRQTIIMSGAFERMGIKSRNELLKTALQARQDYQDILDSGLATTEQLHEAWMKLQAAEQEAGLQTVSVWKAAQQQILSLVGDFISALQGPDKLAGLGRIASNFARDFVAGFADFFIPGLGQVIQQAWPIIESGIKAIGRAIKSFFSSLWDGIKSIFGFGGGDSEVREDEYAQMIERERAANPYYGSAQSPEYEPNDPRGDASYDDYWRNLSPYYMASGGVVSAPTLAVLGESGPEAVVPLGAGGAGVTVILERDGRREASWMLPFLAKEQYRLRLA